MLNYNQLNLYVGIIKTMKIVNDSVYKSYMYSACMTACRAEIFIMNSSASYFHDSLIKHFIYKM